MAITQTRINNVPATVFQTDGKSKPAFSIPGINHPFSVDKAKIIRSIPLRIDVMTLARLPTIMSVTIDMRMI